MAFGIKLASCVDSTTKVSSGFRVCYEKAIPPEQSTRSRETFSDDPGQCPVCLESALLGSFKRSVRVNLAMAFNEFGIPLAGSVMAFLGVYQAPREGRQPWFLGANGSPQDWLPVKRGASPAAWERLVKADPNKGSELNPAQRSCEPRSRGSAGLFARDTVGRGLLLCSPNRTEQGPINRQSTTKHRRWSDSCSASSAPGVMDAGAAASAVRRSGKRNITISSLVATPG